MIMCKSEWHAGLRATEEAQDPPFSNTSISEWHAGAGQDVPEPGGPPFSNTGISEWHRWLRLARWQILSATAIQ